MNIKSFNIAPKGKANTILFLSFCSMFEIFDHMLYPLMMFFLAKEFFSFGGQASLNFAYASFAIGFIVMPISALMWCRYYEKNGKGKLVERTIKLIGWPSLFIALLPNYNLIGIAAPILLILFRIIQCVSASGEVKSAKLIAIDELGEDYKGRASALVSAASAIGSLFAYLLSQYLISSTNDYAWRFAFLSGAIVMRILVYIRKKHQILDANPDKKTDNDSNLKIFDAIKLFPKQSLNVFMLGAMFGILAYTANSCLFFVFDRLNLDATTRFNLFILNFVITGVSSYFFGIIIDHFKQVSYLTFTTLTLGLICIFAIFSLYLILTKNIILLIIGVAIIAIILGMLATIETIYMYKSFPPSYRFRGVMFPYNCGIAVFAGLTPLSFKLCYEINSLLPMVIISIFALITLILIKQDKKI